MQLKFRGRFESGNANSTSGQAEAFLCTRTLAHPNLTANSRHKEADEDVVQTCWD